MTFTKLILLAALVAVALSSGCPQGYFHTRGGCEKLPATPKPVPAILPGPGYEGRGGCHDGFYHTRGGCEPFPGVTCPKGYKIYNGKCIWDFSEPLPTDDSLDYACPQGYFHTRGGCEKLPATPKPVPAILPGPGYEGRGGCHDGFFHTRGGCEPYPGVTCPKGYRIYNGKCIWDFTETLPTTNDSLDDLCPKGYFHTRGGCERLPSTPKPVPAILPGPGYKGKGGCHDGFFHTRDGCEPYPGVTCPKGYRIYNGNCIWDFTEPLPKDELVEQKYINPLQKFLQKILDEEF